jgi:predicted ATPase
MLHLNRGRAAIVMQGYGAPDVEHAYTQAYGLCQQLGDTPQLFPVLHGLWAFYCVRAEHRTARELAERCLSVAQPTDDVTLLAEAHYALGESLCFSGEFAAARTHLEQSLAYYPPEHYKSRRGYDVSALQDPRVVCLSIATWTLWFLGYPTQARLYHDQALELARQLADPFSLAFALVNAIYLAHLEGQRATAHTQAEALIALASEQGFPFWLAVGTMVRGWSLAGQSHSTEGIGQLLQGLEIYRATGAAVALPYYLSMLVEAYRHTTQPTAGLAVLAEAFTAAEHSGEVYYTAELHRLRGELLLMQEAAMGSLADVEGCFLQALDIARQQQAKALELRAAMSLCRLWQRQDKDAVARQMLAAVYARFTEGFDTADLQEARALLTACGASREP